MRFGDVPAWLAWITTFGVLVVALVQIATERRSRHETEGKEAAERHLEQARLISAYVGPEDLSSQRTAVYLRNGSNEPAYTLVVGLVFIQGAGPSTIEKMLEWGQSNPSRPIPVTTASILPAGSYRVWIDGIGWSGIMAGRLGADVAFTDRAENHWIRRALGNLVELDEDPLTYFVQWGFGGPYDLWTPEPAE